ncbi:MAG: zinc-ribbon domain-containing protein [Polyangiaceae bacterium]|nr:zinc-ribbon domain-containing protein [Polyangiaceae bacterium]
MKFVCPNCKAKYQIADERIAGRSVKMKCRKCGHVIHIGHGADTSPGQDADDPFDQWLPSEARADHARAPSPRADPARSPPPKPRVAGSAPGGRPSPPRPSHGSSRAAVSSRVPPAAARQMLDAVPGLDQPAEPKLDQVGAALTPFAVEAREEPAPSAPVATSGTGRVPNAGPAGMGALAGAFQQAVVGPAAAALAALNMPADDWYVGINDVPVGPMGLSALRSKAVSGAVGPDSLVWREGFEDWHPLRAYPELLAVIDEATGDGEQTHTSAVVPAAVFARVAEGGVASSLLATSERVPVEEVAGLPRRSSAASVWLAIATALGLGLTVGFVVFGGTKPPETVVKYVTVSSTPASATLVGLGEAATKPEAVEVTNVTAVAARGNGSKGLGSPAPGPEGTSKGGLKGLEGLKGPSTTGPSGDVGSGSAGQPLDSSQVQRTVSRYTGSVKRSCWQPALDTRDDSAPSTAKVVVTIQVAPNGTVSSVGTSGDPKGYRGLASCIAGRVRGWQFPVSNGATNVNVPFVFAAQ